TLWMSKPKQLGRFDVFIQEIDLAGRTIVDAGAGLADLAAYLIEQGIEYERCIALEGVQAMAEQAALRNFLRTRVEHVDFAAHADVYERINDEERAAGGQPIGVILFSGSLNTFQQEHALQQVQRAWDVASHAVGFNFLSTRHHKRNPVNPAPAVRFDPVHILDWALARTPAALVRQDYFEGHDCTCIMWKQGEVIERRWVQGAN
ncbi:MAG: hypothetical protein F6K17_10005, partial [Okeania sp. SIO3C4]|nr:hypothetical protein [Okeania sp. SIO3C4]